MIRTFSAVALAAITLAPITLAQSVVRFRSEPELRIDDRGVIPAPGAKVFELKWPFRSTAMTLNNNDAIGFNTAGLELVVHVLEADGLNTDDADLIGIYRMPVRLVRNQDFVGNRGSYSIVRRSSAPLGVIFAIAGPWPHTVTGSFGADPDPDDRQFLVARAIALEVSQSGFSRVATAVGRTESELTPYRTVGGYTLIQAEAQSSLGEDPGSRVLGVSITTDEKLNAPSELQLPILSDPFVNITGAFSETLPDVSIDTSSGTPVVIIESDGCDRSLDFVLEFEEPTPRGVSDEVLFAIDTENAVVTDMAGDPVPLAPNNTFTASLLDPSDEPASIDTSTLSFTPIVGSAEFIGQVEAAPGAVSMNNDGLTLGPRVTVLLYASPPAGLIDPEILGAGTAGIAPDGSFALDLTGEGDGYPANAVALISVQGKGGGDADVVLPLGAPCPADLTGDGLVNSADLGALLAAWGPCP